MNHTIAMLTFLAPWWAAGAVAAVGLPFVAHLFSRTRYREVLFPATRFVQRAALEVSRIERPRHRLLMLLRWLVLLGLVLAFMRPRWLPEAEAGDPDQGVALILMIDASASMRRTVDGASLYDRALRQAARQLDALDPARDVASVFIVRRRAEALFPEPTANLGALRDRLLATPVTHESADWAGASAIAQRHAQASGRVPHVVTISDQQGEAPAFSSEFLQSVSSIRHLPIEGPATNTALRLIDMSPYPPIVGQDLLIDAEVHHFGDTPRQVTVTTTLGERTQQRRVSLSPFARQRITFTLPVTDDKLSALRLALGEPDVLVDDDRAGAVLVPRTGSRVWVAHGPGDDTERLADRIGLVLRPGAVEGLALPEVERVAITNAVTRLASADVGTLRTVVLLPGSERSQQLDRALAGYLERGGGLVMISRTSRSQAVTDSGLAWALEQSGSPRQSVNASASGIDFGHPFFERFEGPSRAALSALVWPGVDDARALPGAEVLLAASDGRVVLASTRVGRGRLMQFNADLGPGPGGVLAEPAFVVLFNEACRFASPGSPPPAALRPGEPLPTELMQLGRVAGPSDRVYEDGLIPEPGLYMALDDAGRPVAGVWAELDPDESDPRVGSGWTDVRSGGQTEVTVSTADNAATLRAQPIELWPYLLVGVLMLAAAESGLLARFAGGRGAEV